MRHALAVALFTLASVGIAGTPLPPAIQDGFRFGGAANGQQLLAIGTDAAGNLYLGGTAHGAPLPGAQARFGPQGGAEDLFVVKVAPGGRQVLYVTAIGGSDADFFGGMAVDRLGNVYLAGQTYSPAFPTTPNSYQPSAKHGGAFLLKLDSSGQRLIFSTYLDDNGVTAARGLAIGPGGYIYVGGATGSATFPTTAGAFLRTRTGQKAGFVSKFSPDGKYLAASTLFGDSGPVEGVHAIAVDADGTVVVVGQTASTSFPAAPGAFRGAYLPGQSASGYLARFDGGLGELRYATLIDSDGMAIRTDTQGNAYVAGGVSNLLVEKFDAQGRQVYSTLVATTNYVFPGAMVLLDDGSVYIGGSTSYPSFPTRDTLQPCSWGWPSGLVAGGFDGMKFSTNAVLARLGPAGNVEFSSYLAGGPLSGVDAIGRSDSGTIYVGGRTLDKEFLGANMLDASTFGQSFAFRLAQDAIVRGKTAPSCLGAGGVVPGMVSTVFGSILGPANGVNAAPGSDGRYPLELAGTRVTVDGLDAPLLYVQDGQINFASPQAVSGSTANVCVSNATGSACVPSRVLPLWPTLFSDNFGHNVWNQDGTANSPDNPAPRGSVITLWGTGFGPYVSTLPDGTQVQSDVGRLTYVIGNSISFPSDKICPGDQYCPSGPTVEGVVEYAGMAPLLLFGMTQINIRIPENATKASAGVLRLTVTSPEVSTLSAYVSTTVAIK